MGDQSHMEKARIFFVIGSLYGHFALSFPNGGSTFNSWIGPFGFAFGLPGLGMGPSHPIGIQWSRPQCARGRPPPVRRCNPDKSARFLVPPEVRKHCTRTRELRVHYVFYIRNIGKASASGFLKIS